ncbi:MAG: hypothetical protein ACPK85_12855 [Methanosarcina sp.]
MKLVKLPVEQPEGSIELEKGQETVFRIYLRKTIKDPGRYNI